MNDKITEEQFWLVWNPSGRAPTYRHLSKASANTEARRLARLNPENTFFALKASAGFRAEAPGLKSVKFAVDPIPF